MKYTLVDCHVAFCSKNGELLQGSEGLVSFKEHKSEVGHGFALRISEERV